MASNSKRLVLRYPYFDLLKLSPPHVEDRRDWHRFYLTYLLHAHVLSFDHSLSLERNRLFSCGATAIIVLSCPTTLLNPQSRLALPSPRKTMERLTLTFVTLRQLLGS
jgi:hypothetical protein